MVHVLKTPLTIMTIQTNTVYTEVNLCDCDNLLSRESKGAIIKVDAMFKITCDFQKKLVTELTYFMKLENF